MTSVITMAALGVLLLNTGCDTQKAVKAEPPAPPKPHQFSVVDGTAGLIALRDDGKSCRTADIICANKDGIATTEGRGPSGVSYPEGATAVISCARMFSLSTLDGER
jgi:hypothetical protein